MFGSTPHLLPQRCLRADASPTAQGTSPFVGQHRSARLSAASVAHGRDGSAQSAMQDQEVVAEVNALCALVIEKWASCTSSASPQVSAALHSIHHSSVFSDLISFPLQTPSRRCSAHAASSFTSCWSVGIITLSRPPVLRPPCTFATTRSTDCDTHRPRLSRSRWTANLRRSYACHPSSGSRSTSTSSTERSFKFLIACRIHCENSNPNRYPGQHQSSPLE